MNPFHATVSALCYSLLRERCRSVDAGGDWPNNRAVQFVIGQHRRMPGYLRPPFVALTLAFGFASLFRHGKPFYRLAHAARWREVEAWRVAPFGPCRDLVRFYESFVLFYWHSTHPQPIESYQSATARTAA